MSLSVPFNQPAITGKELHYLSQAMHEYGWISGGQRFVAQCSDWFTNTLDCKKTLLTPSCTHALEMCAILLNIQAGDEIIMPSYTFVSTANAFVLHGGVPVFVDIDHHTMNIDAQLIEAAITDKTKAIAIVHYAGIACDMATIMDIAERHNIVVIEDAAHALLSTWHDRYLGTFGDFATLSFHETKNFTSGEGGALIINNEKYVERAEIIREKGTNRSQFARGEISKYSWVDIGSSYVMSELNGAYLYAQLEHAEAINNRRRAIWNRYHSALELLEKDGKLIRPYVPEHTTHNAHIYYLKLADLEQRNAFIAFMKSHDVMVTFHYVPLHSAEGGMKYARFHGEDTYTTIESQRLARLPLFYNMRDEQVEHVISTVKRFFAQ